ncbi:MAG: SusC/RagA family TonB-linked outer membrane protein [Tannerellaceae bacterium]|nr:SusC/RagA family TonB-linked outer membrane protein [Tannerellaceae bacterium]
MKNILLIVAILISVPAFIFAQEESVTGKVVDKWGNPVLGALVTVMDYPGIQVATDKKGEFEIEDAPEVTRLAIRTGDEAYQEVEVITGKPLVIQMEYSSQPVDMGFGIQQTLAESTGSISRTTFDEIDKRSSLSLSTSLYGNALGLTAMQNPGMVWENSAGWAIRGFQTLNNNDVLVLVDGLERRIQELTVEEIESVSILRDAAAVALYGYKGINGVMSIRTKRGKYKTREIKVSYDHAFTSMRKTPDMADSYTYASALNEALRNDGKSERYNQHELNAFQSGQYPYLYPDVNWFEEVFRDHGHSNIYNVSFRGGGTKTRYYTMVNLMNNSGFMNDKNLNENYFIQHQYSKLNVRTNLDIELTSTTNLQVNLLGVLSEFRRPGLNSDNLIYYTHVTPSALYPVKTEDDVWGGNETFKATNPVALARGRGYSKGHNRSLNADFTLRQDLSALTKGLGASIRFGYDNIASYWEGHTRNFMYGSDIVTSWVNGAPGEVTRYTAGATDDIKYDSSLDWQDRQFSFIGNVDYDRTFGDHKLYTSVIYSYENRVKDGTNNTFYRQNVSSYTHYAYKNRYIADLALVVSGSNMLAPGHKWGFSPTVSAAWVISGEEFMKNVKAIDFLKLRASAGLVQTDHIPTVNYWQQSYGGGNGYNLGQNYDWYSGWAEGQLATYNSTREKGYKYNGGIDAAFLQGFTLSLDGYYQHRKDIWVSSVGKYSSVLGVAPPFENGGVVDSWGMEAGLNYDKQFNDFKLSLGGKFTLAKNEIKEQYEQPRLYDYQRRTGQPVGQIFGLEAEGFFVDQADIDNSPAQQFGIVRPGDIKYKDQNGDGIIDDYDYVPIGYNTVIPEIYYSFNLGFEYKGFGLSAEFQGVGNYSVILSGTSLYQPLVDYTNISNHYYENRWTPDNPFARYPRLSTENNDNNYMLSTVWLADASYLKLRSCEVYYKLPAKTLSSLKMSAAKLYLRGVDLFSIDKLDISDPEAMGTVYPLTKSYHIGFALEF